MSNRKKEKLKLKLYHDADDDEYGGGSKRHKKNKLLSHLFQEEAEEVGSGEEEEEIQEDDDFIDATPEADIPDIEHDIHTHLLLPHDDQDENFDDLQTRIQQRYAYHNYNDEEQTTNEVIEQQALVPSVKDPKLWMVKCVIGHEREVAVCLMQKSIACPEKMKITAAISVDSLKNYVYIEAEKEAHVREAVKGMRNIYPNSKVMLVPIKEMTSAVSIETKSVIDVHVVKDTWVRMKSGTYKGDLAKVVDIDNVQHRVMVKLIPRIDLKALANKLQGNEVVKSNVVTPPARFINVNQARELHIRVERTRDLSSGVYYDNIGGMLFKDGFLYKKVSMKSVTTLNVQPTFDDFEKFRQGGQMPSFFGNSKRNGCFMKGNRVIVVKGDLKNLKGTVEKVEENIIHIKPNEKGLHKTLAISDREICKYFEVGNHVKVVSGAAEGKTGMVVSIEGHIVNIVVDATQELVRVFAANVVDIKL